MHFSTATVFTTVLAFSNKAISASADSFYLTIVPEDGSDPYPADIAEVSRSAEVLSSALEYDQLFTWNATSGRIFKDGSTVLGTHELNEGEPLLFYDPFTYPDTPYTPMEQVTVDGNIYFVKNGTADEGIYVWNSSPTTTGDAVDVYYEGAGSADANAALLLGTVTA